MKRGISPLVATILLVAFATVIGLLVINFWKGTVEENIESSGSQVRTAIECEYVNIDLEVIDEKLYIENNNQNNLALKGFVIRIKHDNGVSVYKMHENLVQPLEVYGVKEVFFSSFETENIRGFEVIPRIEANGKVIDCEDKRVSYNL
jgi:flagellin-like protein